MAASRSTTASRRSARTTASLLGKRRSAALAARILTPSMCSAKAFRSASATTAATASPSRATSASPKKSNAWRPTCYPLPPCSVPTMTASITRTRCRSAPSVPLLWQDHHRQPAGAATSAAGRSRRTPRPPPESRAPQEQDHLFQLLVNKMPSAASSKSRGIGLDLLPPAGFPSPPVSSLCRKPRRARRSSIRALPGVDRQDYLVNWRVQEDKRNIQLSAIAAVDNDHGCCWPAPPASPRWIADHQGGCQEHRRRRNVGARHCGPAE